MLDIVLQLIKTCMHFGPEWCIKLQAYYLNRCPGREHPSRKAANIYSAGFSLVCNFLFACA